MRAWQSFLTVPTVRHRVGLHKPWPMLVPLIGLQRDLVFQPSARLGPPRPFGRALARTGESSRSIVAALMFASFSLSGKVSAPYSFS
jgi:hypothetical protein